jgi:hypothetical protein
MPVINGTRGNITEGLQNIRKQYQESIEYIQYINSHVGNIAHNKEK